jgi:hypothetical protein
MPGSADTDASPNGSACSHASAASDEAADDPSDHAALHTAFDDLRSRHVQLPCAPDQEGQCQSRKRFDQGE